MYYLLPQLVDRAAARWPEHEAIRCRGESLSYATLACRANGLARLLLELGVKRGDRVGILMNKRVECAIAIHGIMKAGAAYVPLDPGAPAARQGFVIGDCGIRVLVTESGKSKAVASLARHGARLQSVIGAAGPEGVHCVSWQAVDALACDGPPAVRVMEQDLCYVLYTSGSTGVPKGIMHSHRSGLAWAEVAAATYQLSERDRISNYAPLHFDLSTLDYYAGALAGATTVMIPEEHTRVPASLSALIADERLTVFYTVPLALIQLATAGAVETRDLSALRWVLFGGEPMPVKHLRELMRLLPGARFANVYGPTETNGCTHYVVPAPPDDGTAPLPIGREYANVETLIVDAEDRPVGAGETGELLVRAPTLMRGYWGREDLNERAFFFRTDTAGLPDRFERTGDLVSRLPDGNLLYHGRKDRQIKARGCRVDLDEIEAALVAHEHVHEAAVFAVRNEHGTLDICAAAIPRAQVRLQGQELLRHLKGRLPAYAVPLQLDVVEEFPRTSTGKIDRRALQLSAEARAGA